MKEKIYLDKNEKENMNASMYAQELLNKIKMPDRKIQEKIINDVKEFDLIGHGLTEPKKNLIEKYVRLYGEKFLDQRHVFKANHQEEQVYNKEFIKCRIRELVDEEKNNFSRVAIDVEGLKTINDIVGHEKGDEYLKEVYKAVKKTVENIKADCEKEYPGSEEELEFIVSAEGGDEFGVLIAGKEDGKIRLEEENFQMSGKDSEAGKLTISEAVINQFNDNLSEIDCRKFISNKDVINKYIGRAEKYTEDYTRRLDKAKNTEDDVIQDLRGKFKYFDLEKKSLEEVKAQFKELLNKNLIERIGEIKRKFDNYKFFASASSGFITASAENWQKDEEFLKMVEKFKNENKIGGEEARKKAIVDFLLLKSDERMNLNKEEFKRHLRKIGRINKEDVDFKNWRQWENLLFHSEVLARNEEMAQLERENQKLRLENEKLR